MSVWSAANSRIVVNLAALLAGRGFTLAVNLVWLVATVRLFAPAEVALLAFSSLAATWLDALRGLGMSTWLVRHLPGLWTTDRAAAARFIRSYLYCSFVPLAVASLATWAAALAGRPDLAAPGGDSSPWSYALLGVALQSVSATFLVILQCFGEMGKLAAWNAWFSVWQRLAPVAAAALLGWGLREFLIVSAALSLLSLAPAAGVVRGWLANGRGVAGWREFWPDSRHYYSSALLRFGATQLDQVLVAMFFRAEMLVTYYVLRRFYSLAVVFVSSCVDAVAPLLAARAAAQPEAALRLLAEMRALILLAGTLTAALTAVNGAALLRAVLGAGYAAEPGLVALFALAALAYGLYSVSLTGEALLGSAARSTRWVVVALAANVASVPVLAAAFGVHALPMSLVVGFVAGSVAASWGSDLPLGLGRRLWLRFAVVAVCGLAPTVALGGGWPWLPRLAFGNGLVLAWLAWERYSGGLQPVRLWIAARRAA
ncbi:MAG: hypothetical protein J0L64_25510 [Acidobacteria bacterium]|nr:hypothetical protein [Acidobacteriota bacterium]